MILKLLLSLFLIIGAGASGVLATQALVSDQTTLTANTFSTGSVSLLLNTNKTSGTFEETKAGFSEVLMPGEVVTKFLRLKNDNSNVALSIAAQAANVSGSLDDDDVDITFTAVDTSDVPTGTPVTRSLAEWLAAPVAFGDPTIADDATQRYKMDVTIDSAVTAAGANVVFDFIFTGTQVL
jgi:hypothetical protein